MVAAVDPAAAGVIRVPVVLVHLAREILVPLATVPEIAAAAAAVPVALVLRVMQPLTRARAGMALSAPSLALQ